jgi:hypothetical protein
VSAEHFDGARKPGAERLLHRHVQVAQRFELVSSGECSHVDSAQAAGLDEVADRCLGPVVVGGDEDIEGLPGDCSARQGGGEGGVEGLDDLRTGSLLGDLGGSPPRASALPAS